MFKNANFLFEIGSEEIPAGYIPSVIENSRQITEKFFNDNRISFKSIEVLATPRRIAIFAVDLGSRQREEEVELKGPSRSAAFDSSGKPTSALSGFLKANSIAVSDLDFKDLGKGEYCFARKKSIAENTDELIPILADLIIRQPFPKRMRWGEKKVSFPRPINYMLLLFNDKVVPFEVDGIISSNKTRGHYIQHNKMISIDSINSYVEILRNNGVIIDQHDRKKIILDLLKGAAKKCGGILRDDEELIDTVTFLVENPEVAICRFNTGFLRVPDIALIAEMREHQKYFCVLDSQSKLTDAFLVISNNPVTENVIKGNERVITARFNDASFFFDEDRKKPLAERIESLKSVLFHKELGSIYDKVERMINISDYLSASLMLDKEITEKVRRAVRLSKTDLMTAMVYEFPSLQGRMGKIYALLDGEDPDVANAIEDHYRPKGQDDELPEGTVSVIASLSEKIDNIFGSFSVGNIPKGSADPYALRRQANAVCDMTIQKGMNISFRDCFEAVSGNYNNGKDLIDKLVEFVAARARTIFSNSGLDHDEIDAVLATGSSDFLELYRKAKSINDFRKDEAFSQMLLSFKRMNNILAAFRRDNRDYRLTFVHADLAVKEELDLYDFFQKREGEISDKIGKSDYIGLFKLIIEGKGTIDAFFDKVLVMDKDIKIRDTRLGLIENILKNFSGLMDFTRIEDKKAGGN